MKNSDEDYEHEFFDPSKIIRYVGSHIKDAGYIATGQKDKVRSKLGGLSVVLIVITIALIFFLGFRSSFILVSVMVLVWIMFNILKYMFGGMTNLTFLTAVLSFLAVVIAGLVTTKAGQVILAGVMLQLGTMFGLLPDTVAPTTWLGKLLSLLESIF